MVNELQRRLIDIGISEKEARVYIALLESGAATADQTAKNASLNRSTTYVQIDRLMAIGLVTTFKQGKKTFFAAEPPTNLERLIEMKAQKLELDKANINAFIPDLMKVYSAGGNRPVVRLFEGKDGIVSLRSRILEAQQKNVYVVTDFAKFQNMYTPKELAEFSQERARRKLCTHVLYTAPDSWDDVPSVPPQKLKRIAQKSFTFDSDIYIFDDNVAFASYGQAAHGMLLKSEHIANTMRDMFTMVWQSTESYKPKKNRST